MEGVKPKPPSTIRKNFAEHFPFSPKNSLAEEAAVLPSPKEMAWGGEGDHTNDDTCMSASESPTTSPDPSISSQEQELTLKHVMAAIHTCQSTLTAQIESVKADLSFSKNDMQKLRGRVTTAEQRISDIP